MRIKSLALGTLVAVGLFGLTANDASAQHYYRGGGRPVVVTQSTFVTGSSGYYAPVYAPVYRPVYASPFVNYGVPYGGYGYNQGFNYGFGYNNFVGPTLGLGYSSFSRGGGGFSVGVVRGFR
jgi:hypothetical protein